MVLESFAAIDEDDWDLVGELAAELIIAVDVDLLPGESAAAMQFGECLFDDLAEVTSFARVNNDVAEAGHAVSVAIRVSLFQWSDHSERPTPSGLQSRYNSHLCIKHLPTRLRGRRF